MKRVATLLRLVALSSVLARSRSAAIFRFVGTVLFFSMVTPVEANEQRDVGCSSYEAVYKPYPSYFNDSYDYDIRIEELECVPPSCPSANVLLTINDKGSLEKLSTVTMRYGCSGGSITHCTIGFTNKNKDTEQFDSIIFDAVATTSDFRPVSVVNHQAPFVLILPAIDVRFRFINWAKFASSISFFTEDKIAPAASTPEVWVFDRCE